MVARRGAMSFSILLKEIDGFFIAHCLELDIVTTHKNIEQVRTDILDLISAQVDYAFSKDNINHLYHPAPPEIWEEFSRCKEEHEETYPIKPGFAQTIEPVPFVPPWITARTCMMGRGHGV